MKKLSKALNTAVNAETLEDIIFEGRNHEYGAYALRKNYANRIKLSLLVVISIAGLITVLSVISSIKKPPEIASYIPTRDTVTVSIKDDNIIILQIPEELLASAEILQQELFKPNISDEIIDQGVIIINDDLPNFNPGDVNTSIPPNALVIITPPPEAVEDPAIVYKDFEVNEQATFKGKTVEDFRIWLIENLKYPKDAAGINLAGTVFVRFTVGKDGKIQNVIIQRSVHPILDQAVVAAIQNSSDDWSAAKRNGNPVNVSYTIPIKFSLIN